MKGRRSVWSDKRIIKIAENFVATTDEVWRLDNVNDDDCRFFQKMADAGHYGNHEPNKSRQGIYVCTANGRFLSSINHLNPDRVLETLKLGLKRWKQLPDDARAAKQAKSMTNKHRWENKYPADGLILIGYARDLHRKANPDSKPLKTWNADSAWFSAKEARTMIPGDVTAGQTFELPKIFVNRMCQIHFVDCVKGQTDPFKNNEIGGSRVTATVTSVADSEIQLTLSGETSGICESGKFARGLKTKLVGEATFDTQKQRFTRFDFVAIGDRWGRTRFNDRLAQQKASPIGFAYRLASPDDKIIVPGLPWAYRVGWMKF